MGAPSTPCLAHSSLLCSSLLFVVTFNLWDLFECAQNAEVCGNFSLALFGKTTHGLQSLHEKMTRQCMVKNLWWPCFFIRDEHCRACWRGAPSHFWWHLEMLRSSEKHWMWKMFVSVNWTQSAMWPHWKWAQGVPPHTHCCHSPQKLMVTTTFGHGVKTIDFMQTTWSCHTKF